MVRREGRCGRAQVRHSGVGRQGRVRMQSTFARGSLQVLRKSLWMQRRNIGMSCDRSRARARRRARDGATTADPGVPHLAEESGLPHRRVMRVRCDGVEEVGAELEESAELVFGRHRSWREQGRTGGDHGQVGSQKAVVDELGEENQRVAEHLQGNSAVRWRYQVAVVVRNTDVPHRSENQSTT